MTAITANAPKVFPCACSEGCPSFTKRTFSQGHDARLVSLTLKEVKAEGFSPEAVQAATQSLMKVSMALTEKFAVAVKNAQTPRVRKPKAKVEVGATVTVKVGRWMKEGVVVRNAQGALEVQVAQKNGTTVRVPFVA